MIDIDRARKLLAEIKACATDRDRGGARLRNIAPEIGAALCALLDEVRLMREHALRAERIIETANAALDEKGAPRRDAQGTMALGQRIRALPAGPKENPR